jgi:DNA polymerase-1
MLTHITFAKGPKRIAILVPKKDMNKEQLDKHYVQLLSKIPGIGPENIVALSLEFNAKGKMTIAEARVHLKTITGVCVHEGIDTVLCCNPIYFKGLTGQATTGRAPGYRFDDLDKTVNVFYASNYTSLFYQPDNQTKIEMAINGIERFITAKPGMFSNDILKDVEYLESIMDIADTFDKLKKAPKVYCDIETSSLLVWKAGILTISFGINKHKAWVFAVKNNATVRGFLKDFFLTYKGKLVFHGSPYDCKVLIWELFMSHSRDITGMLTGLHAMFRNLHDTKIIAYLAKNATTKSPLGLKDLAFPFTGDYAVDVGNADNIPLPKLMAYNATDVLATAWVDEKYYPEVERCQKNVYKNLFRPALKVLTQMELCGMPMNNAKVVLAKKKMEKIYHRHLNALLNNPLVIEWERLHRIELAAKDNESLKTIERLPSDFDNLRMNFNSNPQLANFLYEYLELPILARTKKKKPSTAGKTLEALLQTINKKKKYAPNRKKYLKLIKHLLELSEVTKILTTFIPAFEENTCEKNGWWYLHGGFNLGGALSGRLSSSNPNLTNIPSTGTKYAEPIKEGFQAPAAPDEWSEYGYLMVGADYDSLEDKISALQTKDPNKLKVYTDGYDGHCLRSFAYFGEAMQDIDPNSVDSINSIADKYPKIRQDSKSPTFLLQYMGTWTGLVKQFGFSSMKAKEIETRNHELYKVSRDWVWSRIEQAGKDGYIDLAFGLRLRTPILPRVVLGSDSIPYRAHKEIKTVGNALGQSYGLLNTRAANEFMERVWKSKYATKILPTCQIHDSQYYMIENSLGCLKWVNDNLIECMEWNQLMEIQHPTVKLSAKVEVYHPNWNHKITLPNYQSLKELKQTLRDAPRP